MNLEKYLNIFFDEASEELNKLETLLIDTKAAASGPDSLNSIFRQFHRLKSSSAMMGLTNLSELSHRSEDILSLINNGSLSMDDQLVSLLLSVVDTMRHLVKEARTGNGGASIPETLLSQLEQLRRLNIAGCQPLTVPSAPSEPTDISPSATINITGSEGGRMLNNLNIIRIDESELNDLIDMAGELTSTISDLDAAAILVDQISSMKDLEVARSKIMSIKHMADKLSLLIHTQLLNFKMVPAGDIFERLKRVIYDLSISTSKSVNVHVSGSDIELDRAVVDKLFNPLLHIVRNAIDHGIENPEDRISYGKSSVSNINISAALHGHYVSIVVEDDGRGIDPDRIRHEVVDRGLYDADAANMLSDRDILKCLLLPGVSTKAEATEISGRGMGLDIVRGNVSDLKGSIEISSNKGEGTALTITIPQTLSMIRCLQVVIDNRIFSVPSASILEITSFSHDNIMNVNGRPVMLYRGSPISIPDLFKFLNIVQDSNLTTVCIVIGNDDIRIAIPADGILGEQDILIKSLGQSFCSVEGMLGAGILSGGRMSLILDTDFLMKQHHTGIMK